MLPLHRAKGFTLIELLVAIGILALMAGLSWRGLDGMSKAQTQLQQRADTVLTLQAGLSQWAADLDALVQLPNTPALDWDGRALRITRRSTAAPGDGLLVVAWARREIDGAGQWLRWQSPPVQTRGDLQTMWTRAAQWAQNASEEDKRLEVRVAALEQWKVFYFRADAWTNPLSSDGAPPPPPPAPTPIGTPVAPAAEQVLPDGVRLVLTLPPNDAFVGTLTRDWARITLGGGKP
ncbi:prepilin-type N-terminal cleavage/methylation domain-containing protein [Rhodoferax sp. AJA081-3]|uniref:PulJ/GspJ family protein n=1 Tax=Rhodoferax sp. AJA081-3 TaxID=2752316 RepID=UPI001AE0E727|nr:prepilin-type N-terminal cleavage/methylation domain-containing protein [Rhodoferax sp. AJA081-3]QTN26879.1 prepilin-type N-terminal cleavage/methylation domain-containing protein [Rhodoferax sp. AJA081-3]